MPLKRLIYLGLFLLVIFSASAGDEQRLLPIDEADRDLSFVEFRQQLIAIVKNRNPDAFVEFVSQKISGSNGKHGMRSFVKFWQPETNDSELWPTMEGILNMGGGFVRSERGVTFCAPYIFTNFPDDLDVYGHGVVIADKVPLKLAPRQSATNVTMLSYDLLKVEDWRSVKEQSANGIMHWIKVSTLKGDEGYVDKNMIRSPTDYAACFLYNAKQGWKMVSLVSNE